MRHSQKVLVTNNEDRGWGPLNYALLLHPDILCTQSIVAEDKVISNQPRSPIPENCSFSTDARDKYNNFKQ